MRNRVGTLLACFLALSTLSIAVWLITATAASAAAIPITSAAPWQEVDGSVITAGQVVSYTFEGVVGQVATLDLFPSDGSALSGQVQLLKVSDGARVVDEIYQQAVASFDPGKPGGVTAALPESGAYLIEVDAGDSGAGATGAFTLRFNLIDPGASLMVDDDLVECPTAVTGFVRAAVRAAEANATVDVCAGQYVESQQVEFWEPGVTLSGAGGLLSEISSLDWGTFILAAVDLTIEDVLLHGGNYKVISQANLQPLDGLTISDCTIDSVKNGIELLSTPSADVTVNNCTFQVDSASYAVRVIGDRVHVHDNLINTKSGADHARSDYGIYLSGSEVHVHGNELGQLEWPTNLAHAIFIEGDKAIIEGNLIAGYTDAISLYADQAITSTAIISRNHLVGGNVGATPHGIIVQAIDEVEIVANHISDYPDLWAGIDLRSSGGRVSNNRVTIERLNGLVYTDYFELFSPLTVVNNTVVNGDPYPNGHGLSFYSSTTQPITLPITVTNNLLAAPPPPSQYSDYCGIKSNLPLESMDHNMVAGYGRSFCDQALPGPHGLQLAFGEEGLADTELHIETSSPAVDAGTNQGAPTTDFEGEARPANAAVDIGADEIAIPVDMSVVKAVANCGFVDRDLLYEISVTNLGPGAATAVELLDSVPNEATPVSVTTSQGSCNLGSPTSCALGTLAPREKVTVTLTVNPTTTVALTNEAAITAFEADPVTENNADTITTMIANVPAAPVDLVPTALEVNQAIQNLANGVPIVEQKPTMARLHIQSDSAQVENVGARLYGWRDGVPLPGSPLSPLAPFGCITVDADGPNRDDLQQTHLFDLPPEWRAGKVTLTAVVNPGSPSPIPEMNHSNNEITAVVTFREQPPVCIRTYRVSALDTDGVERLMPTTYLSADEGGLMPRALSLLPTPEMRIFPESAIIARWAPFKPDQGYTAPFKTMSGLVQWQILETLWEKDQLSNDPAECDAADARTHYLGMVHPAATETNPNGFSGRATGVQVGGEIVVGDQLVIGMHTGDGHATYEAPTAGQTLAHELGHNYGRPHPPCDDEGLPRDKNYPYDDCTLGPAVPDAFFGMDLIGESAPVVITPTEAGDLMSYANPRWISDYQWRKIGLQLCSQGNNLCNWSTTSAEQAAGRREALAPIQPNQAITETETVLILSGAISDSVQFGSIHRLATNLLPPEKLTALWATQLPLTATTEYKLNVLDESGAVLYTQPFTPLISTDHHSDWLTFGLLVPDQGAMAALQITRQGSELISRTISANAPTAAVQAPAGGESYTDTIQVEWQGNDADGDGLTYVVQYSADMGQTWRVLQADVTTTTLSVNAQTLPGSLNESLIRIIANDGVNTGSAQSNPFSLAKRAPLAAIQNPQADAVFDTGLPIALIGSGFDAEDGWLTDEALRWSVEGLGEIGSGREIRLPGLAAGSYQITLEAMDEDGQSAVDSITIHVSSNPASTDVYLPLIIR